MIVRAPDGATWRVRVVWEPRWRALTRRYGGWRQRRRTQRERERGGGGGDLPDLGGLAGSGGGGGGFDLGEDLVVALAVIIGFVVFGAVFWWLLLPLLLVALDAVAVVVLLVVGVLSRVLLRRPWTVRAVNGSGTGPAAVEVVGWRAALRARDEMADRLRTGSPPVGTVAADPNGIAG